jgi:hypothetical protein
MKPEPPATRTFVSAMSHSVQTGRCPEQEPVAFNVEYPSGTSVHRATRITINLSWKVNLNATSSHSEAQALPAEPRQASPDGRTSPRSSASFNQLIRR